MALKGTDIRVAARILEEGGLVAIPTETVYGLAANALDSIAVARIFEAKRRPAFDPLIVHCSSLQAVEKLVSAFPEKARRLAEAYWPGPLTLILPKHDIIPDLVTSGMPTAGFRVPRHPLTLALLQQLSFPLAAPSANPFGYVSPTTAQHVEDQLGDSIDYILDGGPSTVGVESTIVYIHDNKTEILRPGGIPIEEIRALCGQVEVRVSSSRPVAPGMLESHYAPGKKVILGNIDSLLSELGTHRCLVLAFSRSMHPDHHRERILSPTGMLDEAAANLFRMVRELDRMEGEFLLVEAVPDIGLGRAINDRLKRMSA